MITSSDMAHLEKMINFELKVEKNFWWKIPLEIGRRVVEYRKWFTIVNEILYSFKFTHISMSHALNQRTNENLIIIR